MTLSIQSFSENIMMGLDHQIQLYDPENPVITLFHNEDYQNRSYFIFSDGHVFFQRRLSDVRGVSNVYNLKV